MAQPCEALRTQIIPFVQRVGGLVHVFLSVTAQPKRSWSGVCSPTTFLISYPRFFLLIEQTIIGNIFLLPFKSTFVVFKNMLQIQCKTTNSAILFQKRKLITYYLWWNHCCFQKFVIDYLFIFVNNILILVQLFWTL